jgi:hypothetical protein
MVVEWLLGHVPLSLFQLNALGPLICHQPRGVLAHDLDSVRATHAMMIDVFVAVTVHTVAIIMMAVALHVVVTAVVPDPEMPHQRPPAAPYQSQGIGAATHARPGHRIRCGGGHAFRLRVGRGFCTRR